jgi:hypothetical protein
MFHTFQYDVNNKVRKHNPLFINCTNNLFMFVRYLVQFIYSDNILSYMYKYLKVYFENLLISLLACHMLNIYFNDTS